MPNSTGPRRQQIAARIHQLLLLQVDHAIDVAQLLNDPLYARDVLLVCDACPSSELVALSRQFREADAEPALAGPHSPGHALQANEWAHDTSGFGVSQPPLAERAPSAPAGPPAVERRRRRWLVPWRRG